MYVNMAYSPFISLSRHHNGLHHTYHSSASGTPQTSRAAEGLGGGEGVSNKREFLPWSDVRNC